MEIESKVKDLSKIKKWSDYYLEQASIVLDKEELSALVKLRNELAHFIFSIQEKQILNSSVQLEISQKEMLKKLVSELMVTDSQLASRITMVQLDQEILQGMDQLAFPKDAETQERDFSTWGHSPMSFPKSLLDTLKVASVPGGN